MHNEKKIKGKTFPTPSLDTIKTFSPILISFFALIISIISFNSNSRNFSEEKHTSQLNNIRNKIDNFKTFEKDYLEQISNDNINRETKNSLSGLYFSKIDQLTNEISIAATGNTYDELEPSLLNDFCHYLKMVNKIKDAIDISHIALKNSKDKYTIGVSMRNLGNFYSINSEYQNKDSSRFYRAKELTIAKSFPGDYATSNLIQSLLLWANDEYTNFNQIEFADSLLDSAMKYTLNYQNNNIEKYNYIKQIQETYNYFNGAVILNNSIWTITKDNLTIGEAYIFLINNNYTLQIDLKENNTLVNQISCSGNFISLAKMRFIGTSNFLKKIITTQPKQNQITKSLEPEIITQVIPQQSIVTIECEIKKNKTILLKFFELGRPIDKWELNFIESF